MAATDQELTQLDIVVDFSIKHDPDGAVLIGDRLPS